MNLKSTAFIISGLFLLSAVPALSDQTFDSTVILKVKKDITATDGICPDVKVSKKTEQYDGGAKFTVLGNNFNQFAGNFVLKSKDYYTAVWEGKLLPKYSKCRGIAANNESPELKVKFLNGGKVNFSVNLESGSKIDKAENKNKMPFCVWSIAD